MANVTLDEDENVTSVFAQPQPHMDGFSVIDDEDPRIAVFLNKMSEVKAPTLSDLQAQLDSIQAAIKKLTQTP